MAANGRRGALFLAPQSFNCTQLRRPGKRNPFAFGLNGYSPSAVMAVSLPCASARRMPGMA